MDFLVWSNEQGAWWKPGQQGYTVCRSMAGRYGYEEARDICRNAGSMEGVPQETMFPAVGTVQHSITLVGSGELAYCVVCGGAEGSLTRTDCPGRKMAAEEEEMVLRLGRDYAGGAWTEGVGR